MYVLLWMQLNIFFKDISCLILLYLLFWYQSAFGSLSSHALNWVISLLAVHEMGTWHTMCLYMQWPNIYSCILPVYGPKIAGILFWHCLSVTLSLSFCPFIHLFPIQKAPIATKVVCFSRLLKCLRSLCGKQCGPRSDCSYRSSLFWVHTVCFYT